MNQRRPLGSDLHVSGTGPFPIAGARRPDQTAAAPPPGPPLVARHVLQGVVA